MLKFGLSAALLLAAAPVLAQPQGAPTPEQLAALPPETRAVAEAGVAFSRCVQGHVAAAAPTVDADALAGTALAACETQRAAIEAAAERLIASPIVPEAVRPQAREQLRGEIAGLRAMIAGQIRSARAAPVQPPTQPPAQPRN